MAKAKILTVRFESGESGSAVNFEFGTKTISIPIPKGHGVVKASAIIDEGELQDAELVTDKT